MDLTVGELIAELSQYDPSTLVSASLFFDRSDLLDLYNDSKGMKIVTVDADLSGIAEDEEGVKLVIEVSEIDEAIPENPDDFTRIVKWSGD